MTATPTEGPIIDEDLPPEVEPEADIPTPLEQMDTKARLAALNAERKLKRRALRDPVEAAKKELAKSEARATVPNAAAKVRAVSANLLPDAAMYQVQKRRGPDDRDPGKLTYDHRYTAEEFAKFGDPRAFIRHFLVPKLGGGEYEVTPTTATGVVGATITYDIEGDDDMGSAGAAVNKLVDIMTKPKEPSEFDKLAADAMRNAMAGDGGIDINQIIALKMLGGLGGQPQADPTLLMLLTELKSKLDAPPPTPFIPSGPPPPDPNALTLRDLMAIQDRMDSRMAEERKDTAARFDKLLEAIGKQSKSADPWETFIARQRQFKALMEEEGGGNSGVKALGELAKTVKLVLDSRMQSAPPPVQATAQVQQPFQWPPEVVAQLGKLVATTTIEDRVLESYNLAQVLQATIPEFAPEFAAFVAEVIAVAKANLAKDANVIAQTKTALRTRLGLMYGGLQQRGAIAIEFANECMGAWDAKMDEFCEMARAQLEAAAVPATPAPAPVAPVQK